MLRRLLRRRARHVPRQAGAPGRRALRAAAGAGRGCGCGSAARARSACCASSRATPTAGTCRSWRPRSSRTRNATLNDWCDKERRDPRGDRPHLQRRARDRRGRGAVRGAGGEAASSCSAALTDFVKPGISIGTPAQVTRSHRRVRARRRRVGDPGAARAVRLGRARALHRRRDARVPLTRGSIVLVQSPWVASASLSWTSGASHAAWTEMRCAAARMARAQRWDVPSTPQGGMRPGSRNAEGATSTFGHAATVRSSASAAPRKR